MFSTTLNKIALVKLKGGQSRRVRLKNKTTFIVFPEGYKEKKLFNPG